MHFHPLFSLFIIPVIMLIALVALPYIQYDSNPAGIWCCSAKGRKTALVAVITALIITPLGILMSAYIPVPDVWMPGVPTSISNGLIPLLSVLTGIFVYYFRIKKSYRLTNNEAVQTVLVLFLTAFLIFMVINIWFRGEGMALMWSWEVDIKGI